LKLRGIYAGGLKTGEWSHFDDTGRLVKLDVYERDSLLSTKDKFDEKSFSYPDERSAEFPGGNEAWKRYLVNALEKASTAEKSFTSGTVHVNFVIDTTGSIDEVYVSRSVEYIIDEESIQIIRNSPQWRPAYQNGRHVKAYRKQPLMFRKELE
jgi:TonB family protein